MFKRYIVLFFSFSLSLAVWSQVLYKVTGNGAQAPSYILATNRLVDMTFIDTIPNVYKCFSNCDKVITEFAMQDYEAISALRQASLLPDSILLSNFLTPEQYEKINKALLLNLGMGLEHLGRMKPSYLTEMFRMELMRRWMNYDENRSMESFFETVAIQNDIPIYGLDDIGETMYMLFDREPFHWQCEELARIVDYPERELNLERALVQMYRYGRLTDMAYTFQGPDNVSTLSYSDYQVYIKRNKEWVKRLRPYLVEGKSFITLNAVYLGGDDGLLAQLRSAGYRVKAVNR
ncbi:MAG: TraB/GumN family protein [Paludibacteraceae bacterium]|jgi:uncharacterized protein YbaP (TraB family)|nr:TraB/GumN family protein [Paludibacteraceae bacterium]